MTPQELALKIKQIENPYGLIISAIPSKGDPFEVTLENFANHIDSLSFLKYELEANLWINYLKKCYLDESRFYRIPSLLGVIAYISIGDIWDALNFSHSIYISYNKKNMRYRVNENSPFEIERVLDFITYINSHNEEFYDEEEINQETDKIEVKETEVNQEETKNDDEDILWASDEISGIFYTENDIEEDEEDIIYPDPRFIFTGRQILPEVTRESIVFNQTKECEENKDTINVYYLPNIQYNEVAFSQLYNDQKMIYSNFSFIPNLKVQELDYLSDIKSINNINIIPLNFVPKEIIYPISEIFIWLSM